WPPSCTTALTRRASPWAGRDSWADAPGRRRVSLRAPPRSAHQSPNELLLRWDGGSSPIATDIALHFPGAPSEEPRCHPGEKGRPTAEEKQRAEHKTDCHGIVGSVRTVRVVDQPPQEQAQR